MKSRRGRLSGVLAGLLVTTLTLGQVAASARTMLPRHDCAATGGTRVIVASHMGGDCATGECCPSFCCAGAPSSTVTPGGSIQVTHRLVALQHPRIESVVQRVRGSPPTPPPNS